MASTVTAPDGTPLWTYGGGVALEQGADVLVRGATAILRDQAGGAAVAMYDLQLRPVATLTTSQFGTFPSFYAAAPIGVLDAGSVQLPIYSTEAVRAGVEAEQAIRRTLALVESLEGSLIGYVTDAELEERLAGFTGGPGGSDVVASDFMRLVLQETSASTARGRLGAGTSSLAIGTTSTTAKAGDWKPAVADLSDSGTAGREVVRQGTAAQVHAALGLVELIQDTLAATFVAGSGATLSYDDTNGRLTLTVAGGGTGGTGTTDPEIVRDVIGAALVAGGGIQVLVNDAADSLTITALLRTVAGKAPGTDGNVALAAGDIASGTFALARATPGSTVTVDYVRSDGYAGTNAWPTSRPSSRADVYFRLTGPRSAFPTDTTAAPYSWMLDGDEPAYEDA